MIDLILYFAAVCGLLFWPIISIYYFVLLVLCIYVFTGGWRFIKVAILTIPRDLMNATVPMLFKDLVNKHPNRVIFLHEEKRWTFKYLDEYSNRIGHCFSELGFLPGEEVALVMESQPEYVGIWLGLAKIGVITALINTHQRMETLIHSIAAIKCKAVIFGSEHADAIKDIYPYLNQKGSVQYFCLGKFDPTSIPARQLEDIIADKSSEDTLRIHKGNFTGTTGLPKAAIIKHCRYIWIGTALRNMVGMDNNQVIYTCIPLYHLAGGTLGTCQCLIHGDAMAISQKFSARNFFRDCIRYECTAAQYIGEICRYLLAQPPKSEDHTHKVKLIFGNGLRPKIWPEFVSRFKVKKVGEFYGSTEGNANVVNVDNHQGCCGFISRIWPSIYPVALIKVDEVTGFPVRQENGLCVVCKSGDFGEFVGKITNDPSRAFDGYVNKDATEKKVIRDVFFRGDAAFLSGDLLYMDELGYLYFKDRIGDTFRWKGENVSTMEVEAVISNVLQLADCIVYGVDVPGCEGKAGMAAILDPERCINLKDFLKKLNKLLPIFSIPIFLRIVSTLEATGTYKLPKNILQKESFDPNRVKDPIFFLDQINNEFVRIDTALYNKLVSGEIRI